VLRSVTVNDTKRQEQWGHNTHETLRAVRPEYVSLVLLDYTRDPLVLGNNDTWPASDAADPSICATILSGLITQPVFTVHATGHAPGEARGRHRASSESNARSDSHSDPAPRAFEGRPREPLTTDRRT
jgi:hypothetical protein